MSGGMVERERVSALLLVALIVGCTLLVALSGKLCILTSGTAVSEVAAFSTAACVAAAWRHHYSCLSLHSLVSPFASHCSCHHTLLLLAVSRSHRSAPPSPHTDHALRSRCPSLPTVHKLHTLSPLSAHSTLSPTPLCSGLPLNAAAALVHSTFKQFYDCAWHCLDSHSLA